MRVKTLLFSGQLIAMAAERMQFDRYVEIIAVCVYPAHRGRGLAGQLMHICSVVG